MFMREQHERLVNRGAVFFGLMDSSPQGFQNWLMTETFGVDGERLLEVTQTFFDLAMLSKRQSEREHGEEPLTVEALETILESTEAIRRATLHHTFPPTALGVRQTTLSHKVHAFLHSLRLEHSTWKQLQLFLGRTFTYTSDMGTEASLSLTSVDVHQDQNSNSHLSLEFEEDGLALEDQMIDVQAEPEPQASQDHIPPPGPADADCRSLDLSALYVPGMFHIIDNATKDVLKRSVVWSDPVKLMLESVLLFFNAFHRRKWFVAKCCVGPFGAWSVFFESAAPKLEGGRAWGVVSELLGYLSVK